MDSRIEVILNAFQSNGWKYIESTDKSFDWWFSDILHFSSIWRPLNTNLFLTLLTDPQNIKEKIVWCVGVSSVQPIDRHFPFIVQLALNDVKKINLDEFVGKVNKIVLV